MSERGCEQCGYHLTGLPAMGTVVSCPECGHANDLSVPLPVPMHRFGPVFWGTGVFAVNLVWMGMNGMPVTGRAELVVGMTIFGLLAGAITAGVLRYRLFRHDPGMGRTPLPLGTRLALSACAVAVTTVFNVAIAVGVMFAIRWIRFR